MAARNEDNEIPSSKKTACNARAQKIVCLLIHGIETEKQFLEQLRWINQSHYQDVVEERAISKMCGYPVCEGKLDHLPRKKYHISVSQNKVFDITERKLFCSNHCYKASTYLKTQLHTSPLWMGNRAESAAFSLFENRHHNRELIGSEVNFEIERVKVPSNLTSNPATADKGSQIEAESRSSVETVSYTLRDDLEFHAEDELSSGDDEGRDEVECEQLEPSSELETNAPESESRVADLVKNHPESVSPSDTIKKQTSSEQSPRMPADLNKSVTTVNGHVLEQLKSETSSEQSPRILVDPDKTVSTEVGCVHEQLKSETSSEQLPRILVDPNKSVSAEVGCVPKQLKSAKSSRTRAKKPVPSGESLDQLVRHVETCMREWITSDSLQLILGNRAVPKALPEKSRVHDDRSSLEYSSTVSGPPEMLEMDGVTDNLESIECEPPPKSLRDFETLRKQTEEMTMKVRDFYRGDKKVTFAESEQEDSAKVDDLEPIVLPLIHHLAPNATRRNAVLNKLNFVLPDLCDLLSLSRIETLAKVKQLIRTCSFSAHNITFKPLEWNLIGLILLKLISVNDSYVFASLQNKSKYLTTVLMSYQLEPNYLDLLTSWLTNPKTVHNNDSVS